MGRFCQAGARRGEHKFAQLNSAQSQHAVGNFLEAFAAAFHDDDFEAIVVVEVDMCCGQNHSPRRMLHFGELLSEIGHVMVVDQGQGSNNRIVRPNLVGEKRLANQIPKSLRPIGVATLSNELIKDLEKFFIE